MPLQDVMQAQRQGYMGGSPAAYDSQGLQMPPEVTMLIQSLLMPGTNQVMKGMMQKAPQLMESEAGAIFPEGMGMPKDRNLIKEFGDVLTPSRKDYLRNQQLSDWHASNFDWGNVLKDKWAMLKHTGGN